MAPELFEHLWVEPAIFLGEEPANQGPILLTLRGGLPPLCVATASTKGLQLGLEISRAPSWSLGAGCGTEALGLPTLAECLRRPRAIS